MYSFGKKSLAERATLSPPLQKVLDRSIEVFDFAIVQGHRSESVQNDLFDRKLSKVRYPNSKHNASPSLAADVYPYVRTIGGRQFNQLLVGSAEQISHIASLLDISEDRADSVVREIFLFMQGVIKGAAAVEGVTIRCGADWDSDNDFLDQTFNDLCHIEVVPDA